ncbi:hypothetical protein AB8955_17250, partial [Yersinia enterocolitica]
TNPDELTQVSDSGARTQLTTPQLQVRRVIKKASGITHWLVKSTITQKFFGTQDYSKTHCLKNKLKQSITKCAQCGR